MGPAGSLSGGATTIATTTLADGSVGTVLDMPSGATRGKPAHVRDLGISHALAPWCGTWSDLTGVFF